jgi:hypothetical protein
MLAMGRPFMISARRGSVPLVHLASSPAVEGVTGEYFSRHPLSGLPFARVRAHRVARAGRDPNAARRLWEESERLVAAASA